jgi:hypothetical protein
MGAVLYLEIYGSSEIFHPWTNCNGDKFHIIYILIICEALKTEKLILPAQVPFVCWTEQESSSKSTL